MKIIETDPMASQSRKSEREGQGFRPAMSSRKPTKTSKTRQRLHAGHFAFMRSVVQGLDTRESWNRYLTVEREHYDIGKVSRTIAWIRDEFAAAARRHDRHGTARLVRIDVHRVSEHGPPLPTVEEFAADHGLEDFSAAEQFEQYKAHYGSAVRRPSRRSRLIARQLDALNWLERLVVQPPGPDDTIASWLHPDLCKHLGEAGIVTLRELVDRINGMGMRWWTGIRAIGSGKAARIVTWLAAQEETIGVSIGAHVTSKRSTLTVEQKASVMAPATGIMPLHKLIVPPALNGANGIYRGSRQACAIPAENDVEAVFAWIRLKGEAAVRKRVPPRSDSNAATALVAGNGFDASMGSMSHTQRAYLKEAERFLLWAVVEQGKALSSLSGADCAAYCEFLKNPSPRGRWCGPRSREKWGPLWRPFEGPLSLRAQRQAITILKSLGNFLVRAGYLLANPWNGVRLPQPPPRPGSAPRFTAEQWHTVMTYLDRLPVTSANKRLQFMLPLLQATGLRVAEAASATVDDLQRISAGTFLGNKMETERWILNAADLNGTSRQLPMSRLLIERLSAYLVSRGLDADPAHAANRGAYLLGKAVDVADRASWSPPHMLDIDPKDGIAPATLSSQIKAFFGDCAAVQALTDQSTARKIADASTHWLRRLPTRLS